MERYVITVIGKDQTGIVARVSDTLQEKHLNIVDISQTVLSDGTFAMIMLTEGDLQIDVLEIAFRAIESEVNVRIFVQHEAIFQVMHTI